MAEVFSFSQIISILLELIPQYVLGCLPAITIIGESPGPNKLVWVLRCLGCPFEGLFYAIYVGGNKSSRCVYWLSAGHFSEAGRQLQRRPFGIHHMKLEENQDDVTACINRCTATTSVLEIWSSLVSVYYMVIGVIAGISRATGAVHPCEDWPMIPLLLSWTIPAILRRAFSRNLALVVKDPNTEFTNANIQINVIEDPNGRIQRRVTVMTIALIITLLLVYFTPPIGYHCRSKVITIFCSIWFFNSALAFLCHLKGEDDLIRFGKGRIHILFAISGFIVAILLIFLGLFAQNNKWWVDVFGESCDISSIGCY